MRKTSFIYVWVAAAIWAPSPCVAETVKPLDKSIDCRIDDLQTATKLSNGSWVMVPTSLNALFCIARGKSRHEKEIALSDRNVSIGYIQTRDFGQMNIRLTSDWFALSMSIENQMKLKSYLEK